MASIFIIKELMGNRYNACLTLIHLFPEEIEGGNLEEEADTDVLKEARLRLQPCSLLC